MELCEVVPIRSGTILAFAGGYLWRSTDGGHSFSRVHKVDAFGIGRGRGIMPEALVEDRQGVIYYGEYHRNQDLDPVHIHRSLDDGKTWGVACRFGAGNTRHIHSLTVDPYTDALWVTTGDRDPECLIAYSVDRGETFHTVGTGSQQWRAVDLLFTEDSVYWGTDSPESQNWICRLDRDTLAVERVCKVDGPIYYATSLCDGTLVMGSAVEGGRGEWDDAVDIWLSRDGRHWVSTPLAKRRTPRRQAVIRFARGHCLPYILATPLNTAVFSEALLKLDISAALFSSVAN
ncbi:MAG: exo-alpha-sialidase [Acidobacteria bacterium]|nr:exo-alpha-sialidase [Acidobacteriota bacterium]